MSKSDTRDLKKFLRVFPKEVQEKTLWLRDFVWNLYPTSNELIYDNYNALAFGWSPTDRVGHLFCNVAVGRSTHNVHFGFYYGVKVKDPRNLLIGEGNQYRYMLVTDVKTFPASYIKTLLKEAYAYSMSLVKDPRQLVKGVTIMKSVSKKKRPAGKGSLNKKKVVKKKSPGKKKK